MPHPKNGIGKKSIPVESPPFETAKDTDGFSVLRLQSVKPVIPKNPPDVLGHLDCILTSPLIDLTINDNDKFELEVRGDRGVGAFLFINKNKREWIVPKITAATDGYKKLSYDLEYGIVNDKKFKLRQTKKARVQFLVRLFAKDFVIGQKWSPTEIRNIVTPPLYDAAFKRLRPNDKPEITYLGKSKIKIQWYTGVLESAPTLAGPWSSEEQESPLILNVDEGMEFYRLRARVGGQ